MSTKIVKLTALNVEALKTMAPGHTSLLETTATTATFVGLTAREALGIVARMQETAAEKYGKRGGAYQSLHAVIRKLETAVRESEAEQAAANDPLVTLLNDVPADNSDTADLDAVAEALGTTVENLDRDFPVTTASVAAMSIRPKAWVTAHVTDVAEVSGAVATIAERGAVATAAFARFRAARQGSSAVPGRLLAASKVGQRRPKRGRR